MVGVIPSGNAVERGIPNTVDCTTKDCFIPILGIRNDVADSRHQERSDPLGNDGGPQKDLPGLKDPEGLPEGHEEFGILTREYLKILK